MFKTPFPPLGKKDGKRILGNTWGASSSRKYILRNNKTKQNKRKKKKRKEKKRKERRRKEKEKEEEEEEEEEN